MRFARLCWIQRVRMNRFNQSSMWLRSTSTSLVVAALLCLAALNIVRRASWSEMEDGVLWRTINGDVVATEIAPGTAAERAGLRRGDVLLAVDGAPIDRVEDVVAKLHESTAGRRLTYTI